MFAQEDEVDVPGRIIERRVILDDEDLIGVAFL